MASNQPAMSFDEYIQESRRKKKNEVLAQEILGKKGRTSAPPTGPRGGLGASLASRIGITKRTPSVPRAPTPRQNPRAPLHSRPSAKDTQRPHLPRSKSATNGFEESREQRLEQRGVKEAPMEKELFIKGAASGPYTVVAQNFASGTTAKDIEAVMMSVGGDMTSCKLVASSPTVIAEMTFVDKNGAQEVIDTFNGKQADGQALYVFWKKDGGAISSRSGRRETPRTMEKLVSAPPVDPEDEAMEVDENADAREAEDRRREERRGRDDHHVHDGRDERAPREMFPSEPRGHRAHMDQYDDRRMNQPQPGYEGRGYGYGGRGYGYGHGYRGAPRGGWGDRRFAGGQSWRP